MIRRYAEITQLDSSIAIQPWGALEWHGTHLPLGLDGLVAEALAERLAARLDAILLPTQWNPMTTLPHPLSLQISTDTFKCLLRETLIGLQNVGFKDICLVTGHYAQGHMVEIYRAAAALTAEGNRIFAATPLELLAAPALLDHAARYETSQLLAIAPDLVRLESIDPGAVLGEDPRLGSVEEGSRLLSEAEVAWATWLASATAESLRAHYNAAEMLYDDYQERYFRTSWEQAIQDWWNENPGS